MFEVIVDGRRTTDAGHPTIRIVPHEHVVLRGTKNKRAMMALNRSPESNSNKNVNKHVDLVT